MPGFKSHYFFGQKLQKNLSLSKDSYILKHEKAYNLGLQGPDIFFYFAPAYLFYKKNIGTVMHSEATMAFFGNLFETRSLLKKKSSRSIADAYIAGFMAHYTMDCWVHPYIYYRTRELRHPDQKSYNFGLHVFLETDMDNTLLAHYLHKKPTAFDPWNTISISSEEAAVISQLLERSIRKTYPEIHFPRLFIRGAFYAMKCEQHMMHDPSGVRKVFLRHIDQLFTHQACVSPMVPSDTIQRYPDPCNLRHKKWRNPWDSSHTSFEDVYELMDQACQSMEHRVSLYEKAVFSKPVGKNTTYYHFINALLSDLGDCSYNSGLPY